MAQEFAVKHHVAATKNFDGAVPSSTPVITNGVKDYPVDAVDDHAGLFEFAVPETMPVEVTEVQIKLSGDQTTWTLFLSDPDDGDVEVVSGTTEDSYFYHPSSNPILLPGQKFKVVTTGSPTKAMFAAVVYTTASIGGY